MARDLGGNRETADPNDDWQRIESEKQDRARIAKERDANQDPDRLFELLANRPKEQPHRENRAIPADVAAMFGRTPEQFEAMRQSEKERVETRAERRESLRKRDIADGGERDGVDETHGEGGEGSELSLDDRGTLITVEGRRLLEIPLRQTDDGPVQRHGGKDALGIPRTAPVDTHIEAHAAAWMRMRGTQHAELYVSRQPCPGRVGCDSLLPTMLAPASVLVVRSEDGLHNKTYEGAQEEKR